MVEGNDSWAMFMRYAGYSTPNHRSCNQLADQKVDCDWTEDAEASERNGLPQRVHVQARVDTSWWARWTCKLSQTGEG